MPQAATPAASSTGQSAADREASYPGYRHRWLIVAVVLAAEIIDMLDSTVVNVAGPTLRSSLGASVTQLQWVIGGYTLALGAGLIVGGRLGDRFGRRFLFLLGVAGFTVFSLLCALAPTTEALIAFRLVQGFAGALLLPQGFGLVRAAFPPSDFGKAFAAYGPAFGLAGILGPIVGGGIIESNIAGLTWRNVFFINIPLGVAAFIIALRVLPKIAGNRSLQVDLVGAGVAALASGLLIWPLIQGQDAGWPLWTWISMAASAVLFYVFVLLEGRSAARGHTPLVEPSVFKKSAFTWGLVGIALYFAALVGFQLVLTLFFQLGHGYSAGQAGLANIPLTIFTAVGGAVTGAVLTERLGRRVLQMGALIALAGMGALWIAAGGNFDYWWFVPGFALIGLGSGMVVASLFDIILSATDEREAGSASGLLTAVQSIAASMGVALVSATFFNGFSPATFMSFDFAAAMRTALLLPVGFLAVFFVLSFRLPRFATRHEAV